MKEGRFGKLRELRKQAGLTQEELAQKSGVHYTHISKLENDPFIQIRPETRQKLAEALETTVEEIWESPYETLDEEIGKGLTKSERAFLRAYMKFGNKHQLKLIELLIKIGKKTQRARETEVFQEAKKRGRSRTKKRKPDP